jgi:hypothetical protein
MVLRALIATATMAAVAALAGTAAADTVRSPQAAPSYMTPTTVSASCGKNADVGSACRVIARFFRAVNSGAFDVACSLLGRRLREDTRGLHCVDFLRAGVPEAVPWGILGARRSETAVSVLVTVGQSELDAWRMRRHRAQVGLERGVLRILATRLVA